MAYFMPTTKVHLTTNQKCWLLRNRETLRLHEHEYHARILPQICALVDNLMSLKEKAHLIRPLNALSLW